MLIWLLIALGIVLAMAAVLLFHNPRNNPKPPAGTVRSSASPSSKQPSPSAIGSYTVPPTDPRYISIQAIKVPKTRVIKLGVTKDNQIAAPSNIYDAGWYASSARPGQQGAMFIYGHISSWTAKGAFYNLKNLKPGDSITVTRGDNKTYTYRVVSSKTYPYKSVNMREALSPVTAGKPGLNLMTCAGHIIKGTSEFDHRLVVFTTLEQ